MPNPPAAGPMSFVSRACDDSVKLDVSAIVAPSRNRDNTHRGRSCECNEGSYL